MACNPPHLNQFLKITNSGRDTVPPYIKPSTQYRNKKAKNSKKSYGHVEMMHPQRTSTYERPFTREGNYLVLHLHHRGPFYERPII